MTPTAKASASPWKPGVYAFIIGVSNYSPELAHGVPKAQEFESFIDRTFRDNLRKKWVFLGEVGKPQLSRETIRKAMQEELKNIPIGSVLFFYFCGHGARRLNDVAGIQMGSGVDLVLGAGDPRGNSIDLNTLHSDGILVPRGTLVFSFLDCCYAGPSISEPLPHWEELARKRSSRCMMLAACASRENANQGAFTTSLIKVLEAFKDRRFFAIQLPSEIRTVLQRDYGEIVYRSMSPELLYGGLLESNIGKMSENTGAIIVTVRSQTRSPLRVELDDEAHVDFVFHTEEYRTYPILCTRRPVKIVISMDQNILRNETIDLSQADNGFHFVNLDHDGIYAAAAPSIPDSEKLLTEMLEHTNEMPNLATAAMRDDLTFKLAEIVAVTQGPAARDRLLMQVRERSPKDSEAYAIASLAMGDTSRMAVLDDEVVRGRVERLQGRKVLAGYWNAELAEAKKRNPAQLPYLFEKATLASVWAGWDDTSLPDPKEYAQHLNQDDLKFVTDYRDALTELKDTDPQWAAMTNLELGSGWHVPFSMPQMFSLQKGGKPGKEAIFTQLASVKPASSTTGKFHLTMAGLFRDKDGGGEGALSIAGFEGFPKGGDERFNDLTRDDAVGRLASVEQSFGFSVVNLLNLAGTLGLCAFLSFPAAALLRRAHERRIRQKISYKPILEDTLFACCLTGGLVWAMVFVTKSESHGGLAPWLSIVIGAVMMIPFGLMTHNLLVKSMVLMKVPRDDAWKLSLGIIVTALVIGLASVALVQLMGWDMRAGR